jgi:hypothetical protein
MKKVQIINSEKISQVEFIENRKGQYRAIVKVQAGFMTVVDDIGIQNNWGKQQWNSAIDVFRGFKKGALQTIQFKAESTDSWLTVFAKSGNKVKLMDYQLFKDMEVGDINQNWSNTNLYSQTNYALCNTKTWADKAFVVNKSK